MTPVAILKMLKKKGYSFTRPTYVLARASKKIAEFEDSFQILLKSIDADTVILYEDESYIRDYQALCQTWGIKGKQRKIKTYSQHKSVGLFGVLDYHKGNILVDVAEQLNAQVFQTFLENAVLPAFRIKKSL